LVVFETSKKVVAFTHSYFPFAFGNVHNFYGKFSFGSVYLFLILKNEK